jgi:hypothetical protein
MRRQCTLNRIGFSIGLAAMLIASTATSRIHAQAQELSDSPSSFAVEFNDCVESIGVTLLPTASVRAYVPQPFVLAGEGQTLTPLVVRTAHCRRIATAGHGIRGGDIVQIGAVVVPPDFSGDINNYTIWYYTTDLRLALRLLQAGVKAQYVPTIDYNFDTEDNTLQVCVPLPGVPRLVLSGSVDPSSQPAGSFVANWWQSTQGRTTKMSTTVPIINIGAADLILTTNSNGLLGELIGASSTGFPIIQQFNTFERAQMQVAVAP